VAKLGRCVAKLVAPACYGSSLGRIKASLKNTIWATYQRSVQDNLAHQKNLQNCLLEKFIQIQYQDVERINQRTASFYMRPAFQDSKFRLRNTNTPLSARLLNSTLEIMKKRRINRYLVIHNPPCGTGWKQEELQPKTFYTSTFVPTRQLAWLVAGM